MSIPIENLSLLSSLTPLRLKSDSNSIQQEKGFAEKFDKALGSGENLTSSASVKAREVAQALTLQMLQSSLALSGDSSSENATVSRSTAFSSINSFLQSYRANLSESGETSAATASSSSSPLPAAPSQLQELTESILPATTSTEEPASGSRSHTAAAWLEPVIAKASQKYGVDVGLIRAIIKAESNFDPHAVSPAGARGLMQLMPATARSLGVSNSFDPEQNVMGGTRFLKDMLKRYDGDVDSALAAYNWGPGNVDRRPDHLPRETRDYLARVKQLYASYSS